MLLQHSLFLPARCSSTCTVVSASYDDNDDFVLSHDDESDLEPALDGSGSSLTLADGTEFRVDLDSSVYCDAELRSASFDITGK